MEGFIIKGFGKQMLQKKKKKCILPFFLALYSTLSSLTRVGSDPYSMADPLQE